MAEKRVLEDYVLSGVTQVRHQHEYPIVFRMVAGAFHGVNAVLNAVGGISLILNQNTFIEAAQRWGVGIQASSSLGNSMLFLGGMLVAVALLHGWSAWSLWRARQQAYWYLILFNALTCVFMALFSTPTTLLQWVQVAFAAIIAALLLVDPRIKAFYHRGSFADAWWTEEYRRVAARQE